MEKIIYICPDCGRQFKQGEFEFDNEDPCGRLWFHCPDCDWEGSDEKVETACNC